MDIFKDKQFAIDIGKALFLPSFGVGQMPDRVVEKAMQIGSSSLLSVLFMIRLKDEFDLTHLDF